MPDQSVAVTLPDWALPAADLLATYQGVTREDLVRRLVLDHIAQYLPTKVPEQARATLPKPPVVRMVMALLARTIQKGASVVYLAPEKSCCRVRARIGEANTEVMTLPKNLERRIVQRLQTWAALDPFDQGAQQGAFPFHGPNQKYNVRVVCSPSDYGTQAELHIGRGQQSSEKENAPS